ncbi:MAG TPA: glycosyltransferase family 4 protein [Candidatus Nanoarchaeia archaeon]|nr:glycosyltransferase family 4 protein [Candidatus Nanoarchaeia archaeon]
MVELKKICILAPEFIPCWGGVGTYAANLVKELSKSYDIHVITPVRGDYYNKEELEREFNCKIHNLTIARDSFFYNFKFQIALLFKFWRLQKENNFDLIHSMNLVHMPDIWLKFFPSYRKIKHLVTIHTSIETQLEATKLSKEKRSFSESMSLLFSFFIKRLQKAYLKRTTNFITVSNFYAKKIKELFGLNAFVVYNGVDPNCFYKVDREDSLEKFPQLRGKKNIVLFVGRFLAQKGIHDLILATKDLDVELVVVGHGDNINGVNFLGYIYNKNLKYVYSLADVLVLPSYYENFPISIIEALNCKCKVIGSNVGGIPEILDKEYLFEAGDIKGIKEKINYVLNNDYKFKSFSSESMSIKTKEIYESIFVNS